MQQQQAVALLEEGRPLVDIVLHLSQHLPPFTFALQDHVQTSDLQHSVPEIQVEQLNRFCCRYLARFENTLEVRSKMSGRSTPVNWLLDFCQAVLPKLEEIH